MKKLGSLLLGLFAVMPVYAQDQPAADTAAPAEAAPADAAPAADAAPVDAAPADAAPAADASAAPAADAAPADAAASTDAAPASDAPAVDAAASDAAAPAADAAATESAPADGAASTDAAASGSTDSSAAPADASAEAAPADAAPAEERKPWPFYVGYDYAQANFLASSRGSPPESPNKANQFSEDSLHGRFHQIRAGVRVFDVIGIEAHYGIKAGSDDKPDSMAVKNNMGLYFVPTGTLFDVVEISALVGYASTKMEHGGKSLTVHGSSYGANLEIPLRPLIGDWMPDIRVGGGFMVYHHDSESRIYGSHFGLRYDFKV